LDLRYDIFSFDFCIGEKVGWFIAGIPSLLGHPEITKSIFIEDMLVFVCNHEERNLCCFLESQSFSKLFSFFISLNGLSITISGFCTQQDDKKKSIKNIYFIDIFLFNILSHTTYYI